MNKNFESHARTETGQQIPDKCVKCGKCTTAEERERQLKIARAKKTLFEMYKRAVALEKQLDSIEKQLDDDETKRQRDEINEQLNAFESEILQFIEDCEKSGVLKE